MIMIMIIVSVTMLLQLRG